MRNEKNVKATSAWLQMAQRNGLITFKHKEAQPHRSQVERGVSIDWLAQFAASIRAQPSLSTNTSDIVETLLHAATSERRCAFVDLIPAQHVGQATAIVCHAWKSDLLGLIMALVDDFNARWDAHKAYRNHHKTAAQLLAEEQAAIHKQQEVARMQQELEAMLGSPESAPQWDQGSRRMALHASFKVPSTLRASFAHGKPVLSSTSGAAGQDRGAGGQLGRGAVSGQDVGRISRKSRVSSIMGDRSARVSAAGAWQAATRQAAAAAATGGSGTGCLPEALTPRQEGADTPQHQGQPSRQLLVPSTGAQPDMSVLALDPGLKRKLRKQSTTLLQRVGPARPSTIPAAQHNDSLCRPDQQATKDSADANASTNPNTDCQPSMDGTTALSASRSTVRRVTISNGAFGQLVDAVRQDHAAQQLEDASESPTRDLKSAAKKLLLAKRALGQGPAMGAGSRLSSLHRLPSTAHGHYDGDSDAVPARPSNMLMHCGTLHRVRSIGPHAEVNKVEPVQDIYSRATASMDLTRLLRPVDEAAELMDAVARAQKAVARKQADAGRTSKDEEVLQEEKKKLMGYYVWIDIFALEQAALQAQSEPDLVSMSRLINVVGRTVVIVDEEWSCLQRLWCLYEMWCTIRFKAAFVTLSTPAALLAAQSGGRSLRAGELDRLLSPLQRAGSPQSPLATHLSTRPFTALSATLSSPLAGSSPPGSPHRRSLVDLEAMASFNQTEGVLLPVPDPISVLDARASQHEDHVAILGALGDELASATNKTNSLSQVSTRLHDALVAARQREAAAPQLMRAVYAALAACSRNWTDIMSINWKHLDAARVALKAVCEQHLAQQLKEAKDLQAVADEDVELELWQLTRFLVTQLAARKEEPFWVTELKRYSNMVNRAYATRFSERYVNQLLKAAGTIDNMKVLRSYVYTQCHTRMQLHRQDDGE